MKQFLAFILSLSILFSLSGCTDKPSPSSVQYTPAASKTKAETIKEKQDALFDSPDKTKAPAATTPPVDINTPDETNPPAEMDTIEDTEQVMVTPTGTKYHARKCGRGDYSWTSLENALASGLTPCSKCY